MWPVIVIALAMVLAFAAFLVGTDKPLGLDLNVLMPVLGITLMASMFGAAAIGSYRGKMGEDVRAMLIWMALGIAIIVAYQLFNG
jgi:hypothetical protein